MHRPVLLQEVLEGLSPQNGDVVFDGTLGGAGHAEAILQKIGPTGILIASDEDADATAEAEVKLKDFRAKKFIFQGNFRYLKKYLKQAGVKSLDKIILDLGLRSGQLEKSGRGFSFLRDEPLLMSFSKTPTEGSTAADIVNTKSVEDLVKILREYGEEQNARRIAEAIVTRRKKKHILSSRELVEIIESVSLGRGKIHPATKTFQALRIATNNELEILRETLPEALEVLRKGGRLAVISFHSLEDRIVKQFFKNVFDSGKAKLITKKPIVPSVEEIKNNPRARSAKLRIIEKIT